MVYIGGIPVLSSLSNRHPPYGSLPIHSETMHSRVEFQVIPLPSVILSNDLISRSDSAAKVIFAVVMFSILRLHARSSEDSREERWCGPAGESDDPLPQPLHPGHRAEGQHRAFQIQRSVREVLCCNCVRSVML